MRARQTETELAEDQNKFIKQIIDSLTHPFYMINVRDYTLTMKNAAASALGNGTTCYAVFHKRTTPCQSQEHTCPLEEVKRTKKRAMVEHMHFDKDGNSRNMEVHCLPIFDSEGNVVQVIEYSLDITERKKMETALKESELSHRMLAENLPGIVYRVFKCENDRIKLYGKNCSDIIGYSEHELESGEKHSINTLIIPEDRQEVIEEKKKAVDEKRGFSIDYRMLHNDGRIKYVHDKGMPIYKTDGKVLYIDGVIFDITDRKHAEEERERLAMIVETATDFVGIADFDGHMHYINPAGRKMLGMHLDEDISELYVPSLYPKSVQDVLLNKAIPTTMISGVWIGEMVMISKEGKEIPVSQALVVHKTVEGKIDYFFTIARDITERKHAEQELIRAKDEALRASSVKSGFLKTMSHELKTPLIAIMGFSHIMKKKQAGELNEKQEHYVDGINKGGTHLLGLIDNILDMVRVDSGEKISFSMELFPVTEAINEILIFMNEKAVKKNISIEKEIDPELQNMRADKLMFRKILQNLIDNAIKFSKPEGGIVTIATRKDGDNLQFSVSDTGIGIRDKDIGMVFDMFHQMDSGLSRKYGGIGIGLAVVKQLVEQQGGRIWVESIYGQGSTFTFTLPLEDDKK